MNKRRLKKILEDRVNTINELRVNNIKLDNRVTVLINKVDTKDALIEDLKYQISQSEEEIEFYRDMYINSESDFQDLRAKYMQLKKTVIKEFKKNQRLKSKNDCLAYNLNRTLHDKVRVEGENRKQSMKIRELMITVKELKIFSKKVLDVNLRLKREDS